MKGFDSVLQRAAQLAYENSNIHEIEVTVARNAWPFFQRAVNEASGQEPVASNLIKTVVMYYTPFMDIKFMPEAEKPVEPILHHAV